MFTFQKFCLLTPRSARLTSDYAPYDISPYQTFCILTFSLLLLVLTGFHPFFEVTWGHSKSIEIYFLSFRVLSWHDLSESSGHNPMQKRLHHHPKESSLHHNCRNMSLCEAETNHPYHARLYSHLNFFNKIENHKWRNKF